MIYETHWFFGMRENLNLFLDSLHIALACNNTTSPSLLLKRSGNEKELEYRETELNNKLASAVFQNAIG